MSADGSQLESLSEQDIRKIAREIIREGFESVAIGLLNSYVNPAHEKRVEAIFRKMGFPGEIVLSSEANREFREYERFSTGVVNAALSPLVSRYLSNLLSGLRGAGYKSSSLFVMNSAGDITTVKYASKFPASIIESGPAAGTLACVQLARNLSLNCIATFDMGGTTAKAGMVIDFKPDISFEFEAAGSTHSGRSVKGSGYSVRQPFIDLAEVSAGGGTIAWVDEGGALRVGPKSAGADPGPAAYGKGGKDPTVSDANIVLGRLNPNYLLGGEMRLRQELASRAVKEKISDEMKGVDLLDAVRGIIKLVNHDMARAISIVSVGRGRDPRDYSLIAFGGAGPLHACDLAEEMLIREIIVPPHPGLFSAYGLLTVDLARVFSKPVLNANTNLESDFAELKAQAADSLAREEYHEIVFEEYADVQYQGQGYTLTIPYSGREALRHLFDVRHKEIYGYSSDDQIEVINAKVRALVRIPKIKENKETLAESMPEPSGTRKAWISNTEVTSSVFIREKIDPGARGEGPCIIEDYDSTTIVNSGWSWRIDEFRNIRLERVKIRA